uniref:Uncharacterized protein n=1 Tax=Cacopsylla melanoneura TaxID=428564 RepID=A0A8D8X5Z2_9HEMI
MLNIIKIHRLFTHSCKGTVVCSVHCTHNLQNFNSVYPVFRNRHRSRPESAGEKRRNSKISIKSPPPFFSLLFFESQPKKVLSVPIPKSYYFLKSDFPNPLFFLLLLLQMN